MLLAAQVQQAVLTEDDDLQTECEREAGAEDGDAARAHAHAVSTSVGVRGRVARTRMSCRICAAC